MGISDLEQYIKWNSTETTFAIIFIQLGKLVEILCCPGNVFKYFPIFISELPKMDDIV